jgi:hypothetical protein
MERSLQVGISRSNSVPRVLIALDVLLDRLLRIGSTLWANSEFAEDYADVPIRTTVDAEYDVLRAASPSGSVELG